MVGDDVPGEPEPGGVVTLAVEVGEGATLPVAEQATIPTATQLKRQRSTNRFIQIPSFPFSAENGVEIRETTQPGHFDILRNPYRQYYEDNALLAGCQVPQVRPTNEPTQGACRSPF